MSQFLVFRLTSQNDTLCRRVPIKCTSTMDDGTVHDAGLRERTTELSVLLHRQVVRPDHGDHGDVYVVSADIFNRTCQ